jgi:hypothetical protein
VYNIVMSKLVHSVAKEAEIQRTPMPVDRKTMNANAPRMNAFAMSDLVLACMSFDDVYVLVV